MEAAAFFLLSTQMPFQILRLKLAIERKHKCVASHVGSRVIVETGPDRAIWRGRVEVFDLTKHSKAERCYAWIEPRGNRSVSFIRLRIPPVTSAQKAVRGVLLSRSLEGRLPEH